MGFEVGAGDGAVGHLCGIRGACGYEILGGCELGASCERCKDECIEAMLDCYWRFLWTYIYTFLLAVKLCRVV